jgi:hypothetical protein
MNHLHWPTIKAKVREAILVLPHFFKNPVQGMRALPQWEWPETLILQALFAASCAVLGKLIERDFIGLLLSLVIAPIAFILCVAIGTGFFYYVFKFFFAREVPFRQIYMHVLFAAIPTLIVSIIASLIPPIMLLGVVGTMILLGVGFVANFQLPARKVRNMLLGLLALYTVFWVISLVGTSTKQKSIRVRATPESLDILEKELSE